jgi:polysaccharide biosynthesis protein PslG
LSRGAEGQGSREQGAGGRFYVSRFILHPSTFILYALFAWLLISCNPSSPPLRLAVHTIRPDDRLLAWAQAAEFDTLVQVFPWREIEPTQDQFHWESTDQIVAGADYYGLKLVVRLDQHPAWASRVDLALNAPPDRLEDYRDFVQRVAERYRGRIGAYIIWNEPNLAIEWGGQPPDPAAFTELLKVGYQAVKAGDPEALVVAAGLAPTNSQDAQAMDERLFLEEMYQAGAYFDILGAHPYSFGQAPDAPESDGNHPAFGRLAELRRIMEEHGDRAKPVWITEMGWTIDPPPEQADIQVSPEQQAAYLVEGLEIIRRDWPWVQLVTVWNLSRPTPGDPFGGYSLLDAEGRPRPVYEAWQQATANQGHRATLPEAVSFRGGAQQLKSISILARDAIIHLGDTDVKPPWWPLYAGRKPSITWTGGFYMDDPGPTDWVLLMELMQQNELGNNVQINGTPLSPNLPQQDFARRWMTVRRTVPASLLHPGYNELTFVTVRLAPDTQHDDYVWSDFQIRNVRLVKEE